jgi:uncharacterized protein
MRLTSARRSALALALALAAALPAAAEPPVPQITVTGEGRIDRAPDMATLSLGVTNQGATAAAALSANSTGVATVIANLKAAGIADRDIQTTGLSLNPNWSSYESSGAPRIDGYIAQNVVTVRVRALDALGPVLDAVVADGANTLNGLYFGLADPDPAMDEARALAVADAQRRAALLAGAAGVKLGRVLTISDSFGTGAPVPMYRMETASAAPVPVSGGEVSVVATVTISWEIAP